MQPTGFGLISPAATNGFSLSDPPILRAVAVLTHEPHSWSAPLRSAPFKSECSSSANR